jgi:HlyD family secretion protein
MKKLLLLLIVVMLGLATAAWWFSPARRESGEPAFSTAPAEYGSLTETVSATAALQPQEVFPVGTELAGKVVEVAADFNQVVSEGDLLLRLDDRAAQHKLTQAKTAVESAKAAVEQARAQQEAAQKAVDRLRNLEPNVAMRKDLDGAEAQLKAAQAAVGAVEVRVREAEDARSLAELGVTLTRVHVPVIARSSASQAPGLGSLVPEGTEPRRKRRFIVLDRKVELNQQVGPPASAQLFLLGGDLAQMQAVAQVAEGDIGRVRRGQQADFTVSTFGDEVLFTGRVADLRLLPTSDHGAIFYKVVIDVANRKDPATGDWQLRPGMTASVDVVVRRHDGIWKVPIPAVNMQMPEEYQSDAARAKLGQWQARKDADQWKAVWVAGAGGKPSPVFVRLGGTNGVGDTAIHDAQFDEVLEWDPDFPAPDPKAPPQFIIGAPPAGKGGLFKLPPVKL